MTTVHNVVKRDVQVVKVVARQLLVGLDMLSVAAKLSQKPMSFDKVGTTPCLLEFVGELISGI